MTDLLTAMATPAWGYVAIFGFLTADAMVPVVPIQAIMITSGALTVYGYLSLPIVLAVGARRRGPKGLVYPVSRVAVERGAGVEEETSKPAEAYADFPSWGRSAYRQGWLPDR